MKQIKIDNLKAKIERCLNAYNTEAIGTPWFPGEEARYRRFFKTVEIVLQTGAPSAELLIALLEDDAPSERCMRYVGGFLRASGYIHAPGQLSLNDLAEVIVSSVTL